MPVASEDAAEQLTAKVLFARLVIRHHALRRRDDGDPEALASALERLHAGIPQRPPLSSTGATAHMMIANPFFGMSLGQLFSTHPDPAERIRRLRAMA